VSERKRPSTPDSTHLTRRTAELHDALRAVDPQTLADRTGATYVPVSPTQGSLHLHYWNRQVVLTYPEFVARDGRTGELLGTMDRAMLAYYFALSDGTPETGNWIAFSELPDGRFYTQAFQGYSGDELARTIGNDEEGFAAAALLTQGWEVRSGQAPGDRAFAFRALPFISLLVVCWLGDEEFPPSYRILFDGTVSHHLSTDACAILGSALTRRLLRVYRPAGN